MYKIQFIGFSKGKVLKGIETLILILILERKKAGSSIPGTSLLDCLKNGRFRYVPLSDEMPEDGFSVGIWIWQ